MTGLGLMVRPLSGWRAWLAGLTATPALVVLDVRAAQPCDVLPLPDFPLTLLVDQSKWLDWSGYDWKGTHRLAIAVSDPLTMPPGCLACVSSVGQVQQLALAESPIAELLLLPSDVAGCSGRSAGLVLIQEALRLFPQTCIQFVSTAGPHAAAALLSQGVDTVLLSDQFFLLADYPLPVYRQGCIARLQRGSIRRFTFPADILPSTVQVAALDPADWRPSDPVELERYLQQHLHSVLNHCDTRLTPMSEGVLLSRVWSRKGLSCSDVIRLYQRVVADRVNSPSGAERGRAAMASWLGTRLPVVQGPMTRVSDTPAFARSVGDAGAMPVLAAAMLPADRLGHLLRETASACVGQPWGVGLLAFRPDDELRPQIQQVIDARPDLIVLAGGQPSQIAQFGDLADRVILHSPTPELFERQLSEGCRRFILEGRECGGHTGPCASLSLWEGCLHVLAQQPRQVQDQTFILFAGGLHGSRSTTLIAELLHQFSLSHTGHGLLVGTLTLFSEEAVATGAITPVFQSVLLDTVDTVLLETSPGHQSRCALTPFADEFLTQRRQGLDAGLTASELASSLDSLILGRLRLASKGLKRYGQDLLKVSDEEQYSQGMFMVGEVAALQQRVAPLSELFKGLLPDQSIDQSDCSPAIARSLPEPIAITGMSVVLPGATSLAAYWSLIIRQKSQIRVVPEDRWPVDCYYNPEGSATSVVSCWGTFIEPTVIDLAPYPLTPAQVAVTEPTQILALELVSQALAAVGPISLSSSQRERTAVVFAASGGAGELGQAYTIQTALASDPERFSPWLEHLPKWTNSSFPGLLANVTAGRISNAFDLSGANLLVDAACASSLAAVDVAVAKLRSGECERAIVGSVDNLQGPFPYFCFSQSGALSRQGQSRPFCTDSDGIVIGEGCVVVVLERLDTACRSGADIYAVIDAIGSSSDGKGRSLTAPSHRGQMLAFERAFAASDRHPSELRYYEAHGTGTPVGDRSEMAALTGFLQSSGVDVQRCAVGSVKALIGHTKATAGLAGLVKAALALRYGTLPGQQPVREPLPELSGDGPVYVPSFPAPWPSVAGQRLAAVSAFGFGGTNFTVLLSDRHRRLGHGLASAPPQASGVANLSVIALPLQGRNHVESLRAYRAQLCQWLRQLAGVDRPLNHKILMSPCLPRFSPTWLTTAYLALDRTAEDGIVQLEALERRLNGEAVSGLFHVADLSSPKDPAKSAPPLVLLFPGQGSVYPGMGAVWMLSSSRVREALDLLASLHPEPDLLIRVLGGSRSQADREAFWKPSIMQVILMLHQLAAFDCLVQFGLKPDAVLGHSIGDYLALHASGALPLHSLIQLVVGRALCIERCLAGQSPEEIGGMLVVKAPLSDCEQFLSAFPGLRLANRNAPTQGVIAGPASQLFALETMLKREGVDSIRLDLPVAYHHPDLETAAAEFSQLLDTVVVNAPHDSCHVRLSTDPELPLHNSQDIREALRLHLCRPVDFISAVARTETVFQGATYVDVGPRQIGSRLLQANGVTAERTLRMDDQDDPASQLVRIAFDLLERGLPLDEGALMQLASRPPQASWTHDSPPRLPYLVNGHAAVPLDGRPMPPSPLVPVTSSILDESNVVSMPNAGDDRLLEVYAEYQRTMRKFLESQDQVFSALASGHPVGSPEVTLSPPEPQVLTRPKTADLPQAPSSAHATPPPPQQLAVQPPSLTSTSESEPASPFSSEQAMQNFIIDVLVDRTGYPPELLELDAHLESDLGIDSIKQVEVLGALIEALPHVPSSEQMQDIRAAARQKQTIKELSRYMLSLYAGKV